MVSLIVGAVIAGLVGYLTERTRRDWRREEERAQWTRQARLEAYGRLLGQDRVVTDLCSLLRNLKTPDLREERSRRLGEVAAAVSGLEVAYGQAVLVASEPLIEATNELRSQVLAEVIHAASGDAISENLKSARLVFNTIARIELGIRFDLGDELKVLGKKRRGPKSSTATID